MGYLALYDGPQIGNTVFPATTDTDLVIIGTSPDDVESQICAALEDMDPGSALLDIRILEGEIPVAGEANLLINYAHVISRESRTY